jgi:hypothetical protein
MGQVGKRLHLGFSDPAKATSSEEHVLSVFRQVPPGLLGQLSETKALIGYVEVLPTLRVPNYR